jgi:hypothetical protein
MVGALALSAPQHPAVRRRMAAIPLPADQHEVVLRPFGGGPGAAMIVTGAESDFIGAVLDDLAAPDATTRIAARSGRRRGDDGVLELHQPIHRRFHLMLLEVICRVPGSPPTDPAKFAGMGLVLRRIAPAGFTGWMKDGARRRGWLPVAGDALDPDPAQRPQPRKAQARQIAALIAARRNETTLAEQVVSLFAAPPALCTQLGKTILYGVLPVASGEESDLAPAAPDYNNLNAAEDAAMRQHFSGYFKQRPALAMPHAGQVLDPGWRSLDSSATDDTSEEGRLKVFGIFLQQLLVELDAFGSDPACQSLITALNRISLPLTADGRTTIGAGDFAARAAPILVGGEPNTTQLVMPQAWPAVDAATGDTLVNLALACLSRRFAALATPQPKFDSDAAQYRVRGFIRVAGHVDCPPRLVWSDYSEPFRILPWWDGDGPVAKVNLPDISALKKLKPNVAFQMPPSIAALLQADPTATLKGTPPGGGIDIFWLCSFSIPAITICAFITFGIFLSLFNLFFFWMAWIKICIPIPKPK